MALIVQKYGGTSVNGPERVKNVARRVVNTRRTGNDVIVIVSAPGDMTDDLIALAHAINPDPPAREMDMLLATGEQTSIALLAMAIHALGEPVISLTGPQVGILTDNVHSKARILEVGCDRLRRELEQGRIVIVAGFQGKTCADEITTLGRGGSDTTAVAVAAALQADVCQIYTDVDGVYTADPRVVPEARKLAVISYDEMLELASLGAQVLQPRSVEFGKLNHVVLEVRSSFNDHEGTLVKEVTEMERKMVVSGIAGDRNVARIALYDVPDRPGIAKSLFVALAREGINVDMIVQSAMRDEVNDIAFTVTRDDLHQALAVTERVKEEIGASRVTFNDRVAKVSIVGAGMITNPGVAAAMFACLAQEEINIHMISTSEIKVSCIIDEEHLTRAMQSLHRHFGLDKE
ncbi:aspartate kinase [Moorella naiadis]|uniref:aspartate kinase n=1 Tax=Moorella naiadis (nom. illeg.) TaxID=3093670 RepID=UPI003D9CA21D